LFRQIFDGESSKYAIVTRNYISRVLRNKNELHFRQLKMH